MVFLSKSVDVLFHDADPIRKMSYFWSRAVGFTLLNSNGRRTWCPQDSRWR